MTTNVISTTLSSASSTDPVVGKVVDVHLYDSSSFDGTFQIQRRFNTNWRVVDSGTQADLPYDKVVENAHGKEVRVTVSAYTSGTLGVELA